MRLSRIAPLLALLALAIPTAADDAPAAIPPPVRVVVLPPTPQQLIARLGSRSWRVRNAASRQLVAHGSVVVPRLKALASATDPEVRARARDIVREITSPPRREAVPTSSFLRRNFPEKYRRLLEEYYRDICERTKLPKR